jgi:hypothetical protein
MQTVSDVIEKAKGRKDKDGQAAVMKPQVLKAVLDDGVQLKIKADEAAEKYGDWVKAQAEKCGLLATVVRKVVNAKAADTWEEEARKAEQLNLAFDEIGGAPAAK